MLAALIASAFQGCDYAGLVGDGVARYSWSIHRARAGGAAVVRRRIEADNGSGAEKFRLINR